MKGKVMNMDFMGYVINTQLDDEEEYPFDA